MTDYCAFWCADTFSLSAAKGIYQIAAVKVRDGEITEEFQQLIRPWDGIADRKDAAKKAGLSGVLTRIGMDAHLGKIEENGIDISGGEWQRVAMARSIASPSEVKILDEPTAALDPIAESEIYNNFRDISHGRTTIFISHRLGSTKLADTIFVLYSGHVAECGSHDELMEQDGLYAEMFDSQRSWYL